MKKDSVFLKQSKAKSLKAVSIRILFPVCIGLIGLLGCLIWGLTENRRLVDWYIRDTVKIHVDSINKNMSQIGTELIFLLGRDEDISDIPSRMSPEDGKYYGLQRRIVEQNRILKIRYPEVQTFYVYGRQADVLITDAGTVFSTSEKSGQNERLMTFLHENSKNDTINTHWQLMESENEAYIISWYVKNQKAMGCVIRLDAIFDKMQEVSRQYEILPFVKGGDGRVIMPGGVEEELRHRAENAKRRIYAYQLGNVGKIFVYVLPKGILMNQVLVMQIFFVFLIGVLILLLFVEIYFYYLKVLEPIKAFADDLENADGEVILHENGENKLVELEVVSGRFKELLRKIQMLKIQIYEKELLEKETELEYMQEQIKPHFFLNCLSLIHGMADVKKEYQIVHITEVLSEYMRYIFKENGRMRSLSEEMKHVSDYVEIQKIRYGDDSFQFEAISDGVGKDVKIPALILQMLVENAIVHGVTLDGGIEISLYITKECYKEKECLYICMSDTGKGFSEEVLSAIEENRPVVYGGRKHVGLLNIKRRLALLYGDEAEIIFSNMKPGEGAIVEIRIPLREEVEQ